MVAVELREAEAEARDTELLEEAIWGDVLPSVRQLRERHPGMWGALGEGKRRGDVLPLWC